MSVAPFAMPAPRAAILMRPKLQPAGHLLKSFALLTTNKIIGGHR